MFVVKTSIYTDPKLALEDAKDLADTERKTHFIGVNKHGYFITKQRPAQIAGSIAPERRPAKGRLTYGEKNFIRFNWGSMTAKQISIKLKRSDSAVIYNAKKMGLK